PAMTKNGPRRRDGSVMMRASSSIPAVVSEGRRYDPSADNGGTNRDRQSNFKNSLDQYENEDQANRRREDKRNKSFRLQLVARVHLGYDKRQPHRQQLDLHRRMSRGVTVDLHGNLLRRLNAHPLAF